MRGKKRRLVIAVKRPEKKTDRLSAPTQGRYKLHQKEWAGSEARRHSVICDCGLYKLHRLDKSNGSTKRTRVVWNGQMRNGHARSGADTQIRFSVVCSRLLGRSRAKTSDSIGVQRPSCKLLKKPQLQWLSMVISCLCRAEMMWGPSFSRSLCKELRNQP